MTVELNGNGGTISLVVPCLLQFLIEFRQAVARPYPLQIRRPRSNKAAPYIEESPSDSEESIRSSTVKSTTTDSESGSYFTRLDFISVVVICGICALCFGVCVVLGCRKKKRHPSSHGITSSSPPPSFTDSRSEPRITNLVNLSSGLRIPETPPPTYSIIERQTSFTSYISQTSSQCEIPPNYDEAVSLGKASNGDSLVSQIGRKTSLGNTSTDRSAGRFLNPNARGRGTVAVRSKRSESARSYCPPRVRRFYHSSSDVGRTRRTRLLSRPATVSEDDSPTMNATASSSALTTDYSPSSPSSPSGRNTTPFNASQTINVSAEVLTPPRANSTTSEHSTDTNLLNSHR